MYAILKLGGHQYRVTSGDRLLIDRIPAEVGATITLEHVLLVGDDAGSESSTEKLADTRVTATVVAHRRGKKLRVFTYKPKKRRRRTLGHRSQLTELRVEDVLTGAAKPAATKTAAKRATPRKKADDGA